MNLNSRYAALQERWEAEEQAAYEAMRLKEAHALAANAYLRRSANGNAQGDISPARSTNQQEDQENELRMRSRYPVAMSGTTASGVYSIRHVVGDEDSDDSDESDDSYAD